MNTVRTHHTVYIGGRVPRVEPMPGWAESVVRASREVDREDAYARAEGFAHADDVPAETLAALGVWENAT